MTRLFGRSQPQRPSTSPLANKTAPHQGSGNTGSGISETLPPLYRHLASFVPTRAVSLFGVAAIQLCALSLALVPCLAREFASYEFAPDGGEYSLSVDILKGGFQLQGQANLAGWLTQTFLLLATGVALILRYHKTWLPTMGNTGDRFDQYVIGHNTTDRASSCSSSASVNQYAFWTARPRVVGLGWLFVHLHFCFCNVLQTS